MGVFTRKLLQWVDIWSIDGPEPVKAELKKEQVILSLMLWG